MPHPNSTKFIDLPDDILTECLMSLDAQDLLKCIRICSRIRTLIDTDIRLRYMIELYANNMVHNPRFERPESLHSRLKRLAEYQRRIRSPRLEKIDSFTQAMVSPPNEDGRGVAGGIQGIVIAWTIFGSLVRFTQTPSRNLGIQSSQYDLRLVDASIVQLTFDPAQDLVVVLETTIVHNLTCPRVSVRSLLTGEKHPMAAKLVCWLGDSDIPLDELFLAVCGDHVALTIGLLGDRVTNVIVFNWKTSNMQNIERGCILQGYEWLSEQYLLLVETHSNPTALALTIVDLNPDHPVICILNLPRMLETAFEFDTSVQIITHPSSQGILSQRDVPFLPDPENKLVLVSFYAHIFGGFFVSVLASDLLKIARENTRKGSTSVVAWDDWGTTHTRVIQVKRGGCYISVYGTRALVQDAYDDGMLALYDFNQKLIRRDLANQAIGPDEIIKMEPTVVKNEVALLDEVKSCLPFRIAHFARPKGMHPARTCELSIDSLILDSMHGIGTGNDNIDIYSF
ncbi:hypothetical protein JOM56_003288 [Amanita muscaria]